MRIGIDARPLSSKSPSGIGIYLLEILKNIKYDESIQYVLYSNASFENDDSILDKFEKHVVKGKIGTITICFGLRKQLKKDKIDVFWGTEHMLPLNCRSIKKVLTVHDLALLINPKWGSKKNAIMQNVFCRFSCIVADRIISVSEATKNDLVRILSISPDKIVSIYNGGGYDDIYIDTNQCQQVEAKMEVKDCPFFSYIGNIEPRKNIVNIVKAFDLLNDEYNGKYKLVLAGKMGWRTEPIRQAINESRYKGQIVLPGYISEFEKKYLMKFAQAFVFPSNYEGFGIPVVEAFSCEGVVITSNNSSLKEEGGDAAFYISDPENYVHIYNEMKRIVEMSPADRRERINKGKKWAEKFNWNECAFRTQKVVELK